MSEFDELSLENFGFEADGQVYEVGVEATPAKPNDPFERYGVTEDAIAKLQQARQMIRAYTLYAVTAFKDFGAAEVEEITLTFGIKLGGKAGIPYVTEGTTESNMQIQVKCKYPQS